MVCQAPSRLAPARPSANASAEGAAAAAAEAPNATVATKNDSLNGPVSVTRIVAHCPINVLGGRPRNEAHRLPPAGRRRRRRRGVRRLLDLGRRPPRGRGAGGVPLALGGAGLPVGGGELRRPLPALAVLPAQG